MLKILFFLFFFSCTLFAQSDKELIELSKSIKAEDLKKHLSVLASDAYEGRETGEYGQKIAAKYLSEFYEENNIASLQDTSYLQSYPILSERPKDAVIKVDGKSYKVNKDFYYFPRFETQELKASKIIFAGYGISDSLYDDYKGLDVANKIVVIFDGEPMTKDSIYLVSGTKKPSKWNNSWRVKAALANKLNINCLLIIDPDFDKNVKAEKHRIEKPYSHLEGSKRSDDSPFMFLSVKTAKRILGKKTIDKVKKEILTQRKSTPVIIEKKLEISIVRETSTFVGDNVLACIKGTEYKDEYIVISAHYDHLGKHDGQVFYGADDDGSGTVAVMELAQAFKDAENKGFKPKRSILFLNFSGEEKGLLGSDYYTQKPIVPLKNTVANFNIDMIGRLDKPHENNSNYVYLIGADKLSSDLHKISEEANRKFTKIDLDYSFNKPGDPNRYYYRSDHYNFAKNNIPVIFYFNGVHADYHKSTDTVDKIDFNKMEKITRLVFHTVWEVANKKERLKIDKTNDFKN